MAIGILKSAKLTNIGQQTQHPSVLFRMHDDSVNNVVGRPNTKDKHLPAAMQQAAGYILAAISRDLSFFAKPKGILRRGTYPQPQPPPPSF